jgi:hypothetical protein
MRTTCHAESRSQGGITPTRQKHPFPEDLRLWLKGPALVRLAHVVAQEHTVSTLRPVFSLTASRFHHPWKMLALLTYAYSSGIWHSRAVTEISMLDPYLSELCAGEAPSPEMIRRFRAHNNFPLVRCLELSLRRIWCQRNVPRNTELPSILPTEIICNARWRLQRAEESDAAELHADFTDQIISQGG